MTQLTEHFSLAEMTVTRHTKFDNVPKGVQLDNLKFTAERMEEVRELLGNPITISSAYRSPEVNRAVGSKSKHSQHMDGCAVDFTCSKFGTPREIVKKLKSSSIPYDQLILEFDSWVHISFKKNDNRKQSLVIDSNGTRIFA